MVKSILFGFLLVDSLQGFKQFYKTGYYPENHEIEGQNILEILILSGSSHILEFLLTHGVDPNMKLKGAKTPIEFCYLCGRYNLVKTIEKYGGKGVVRHKKDCGYL
ncbi:MAG: hypothetical protein ISR65_19775 [Bacteriovoracaceae bacterium]|nr:hypothetical protein [Bacteriovoracaceae bacterium]